AVFEVGFGTGLNAFLAMEYARQSPHRFTYTTVEAFPLERSIWSLLNYASDSAHRTQFHALHECPWNQPVPLMENFVLTKVGELIQNAYPKPGSVDVIFFDAFAPGKQPELWEPDVLARMAEGLRAGGVFVTYSAKGQLKRDLRALSLAVETLPGPPGKKEMTRAVKM
ncbi:MAG TPA: tRNA (5-methylaminomethyl-2-thiouridine)(34)-methyltransferase MnmD, partial [Chryseosolibacter sp.]|nr:tRNA (5-methylaminomethyl-2-thiouridine)(34)-methyltransferase MnmD [Chryseosolibacter sp.]